MDSPLPSPAPFAFAAALICGGRSVRMGRDKAFISHEGVPLWQHQLKKLRALRPTRLHIACRAEQEIVAPDAEVLHDPEENQGPLPALRRCLEHTHLPTLILGVDMPHMRTKFLQWMLSQCTPDTGLVCQNTEAYEPLAACYPPAMLPLLREAEAAANYRLQHLVRRGVEAGLLRVHILSGQERVHFTNLNTPDDLR